MENRTMKYNPSLLSDETLEKTFVVRERDLGQILRIIGENTGPSNQHILVIGPRGSGKTTLALRTALAVRQDENLNKLWYPLRFAEESYEITSAGEFWLETLFHLGEQTGESSWKEIHRELKKETDDNRLGERALGQLLDFADSIQKRILLIVENLNMLFDEQMNPNEAWKLRHTLLHEPRIMLLATATNRFDGIDNANMAMFDLFKIHMLHPLDDAEANKVWGMITGQALGGERIRPIRILTGGNPRLLTVIAKFGAGRSFSSLLDDLIDLIDDHTEYFKSHLDRLAPTERKVYLALAERWDPSTAREIAEGARLDVNKTSSLLKRLSERGAVEIVKESKRSHLYAVSERMYNIYYLFRRRGKPANRVQAAVKFMVSMYDVESAAGMLFSEAGRMGADACKEHYLAYAELLKEASDPEIREKLIQNAPEDFLNASEVREKILGLQVKERSSEFLERHGLIYGPMRHAFNYFHENRFEKAIAIYDEVIEEFSRRSEPGIVEEVAMALFNKGVALGELEKPEEAVVTYSELIERFEKRDEPGILERVAMALVNKGAALGQLGKSEEEIATYNALIERFDQRSEPEILKQVAMALFNKGVTLGKLGKSEEEIATYNALIERFEKRDEPGILERVAMALVNKGAALGQLGKSEEEIATYNALIERFEKRDEPGILERVAKALFNKGVRLGQLGKSEEEIAIYNALIERFEQKDEPGILEPVAKALRYKGNTLKQLGKSEEAVATYDALIKRFEKRNEPKILGLIAEAFIYKGTTLDQLHKPGEAKNIFNKAMTFIENAMWNHPDNSALRNISAWTIYTERAISMFPQAENWVREANMLEPENAAYQHTLACILAAQGKGEEALAASEKYLSDADFVQKTLKDAITLFVELGAAGYAKEAFNLLQASETARFLEPLVAGLKLYMGEEVRIAFEIEEVAKDIRDEIEARKKEREAWSKEDS